MNSTEFLVKNRPLFLVFMLLLSFHMDDKNPGNRNVSTLPFPVFQNFETIKAGAYIINMGVQPQTVGNGIKPYGLVWHLIHDHNIPVKWSILNGKGKDGVDFSYNGMDFRGGPFLIEAAYRTPAIDSLIQVWEAKGVSGITTTSDITIPIFKTISYSMNWTLDLENGKIAQDYLIRAEIPESAYNWTLPSELNCCNDVFAMPHAEPTWETHQNLLTWNRQEQDGGCRGAIWAGCKAVSELENIYNPANPGEKMNFLMEDAIPPRNNPAVWANDHSDGKFPPPYEYYFHDHPIMQFLGKMDGSQQTGAEQVYLPTNAWRPSTLVAVIDGDHPEVPSLSPGPASKLSFGYAFGDTTRGYVVYEAAHRVDKDEEPANIAAQRVFFNFAFMAVEKKAIKPFVVLPEFMENGNAYNLSVSATGGSGNYFFHWETTCSGTIENEYSSSTTFTPAIVQEDSPCFIKVTVQDDCGTRIGFHNHPVTIKAGPAAPLAADDFAQTPPGTSVQIVPLSNDLDPNGDSLSHPVFLGNPLTGNGTFQVLGDGTVSYTSVFTFTGTDSVRYQVCDQTSPAEGGPLCDTATIFIHVNWLDDHGCYPDQYFGIDSVKYAEDILDYLSVSNPDGILGPPVLVPSSNSYYAKIDNNSDYIMLDLNRYLQTGDSIWVYFGSDDGNTASLQVESSGNPGNFYNPQAYSTQDDLDDVNPQQDTALYLIAQANVRYLKFTRVAGQGKPSINGIKFHTWKCLSAIPEAVEDLIFLCEDNAVVINVRQNDSDPQNLPLSVKLYSPPNHGAYALQQDGNIRYVPNLDYSGQDTFFYQVCNLENLCQIARVILTISPDACPSGQYHEASGSAETIADDFSITGYSNNTGSRTWQTSWMESGDDGNPGGGDIKISNGLLEIKDNAPVSISRKADLSDATSATLRVTVADHDLSGNDQIAIQASNNGGASFTTLRIYDANSPASSVESFDLFEFLGVPGSNTVIRFARLNGSGKDKLKIDQVVIEYTLVSCSSSCESVPVFPPMAVLDKTSTLLNQSVSIPVQQNDVDPSGLGMTTTAGIRTPQHGTITLSGENISYRPNKGFTGPDTFSYAVCNPYGCDTALAVVITYCADPGSGNAISGTVYEDLNKDQMIGLLEPGLENIRVRLYEDSDQNSVLSPMDTYLDSAQTNADGVFAFQVGGTYLGNAATQTFYLNRRIASGMEDAEEEGPNGQNLGPGGMNTYSSSLELGTDLTSPAPGSQTIGLYFSNMDIPKGAIIQEAFLDFTARSANPPNLNDGTATLSISLEASANPLPFNTNAYNLSNRICISDSVYWSPAAWSENQVYTSPDLKALFQKIVNLSNWQKGQSMVVKISGTGSRTAFSYNGSSAKAPLLRVRFEAPLDPARGFALWSDSDAPEKRDWNGSYFESIQNTLNLGQRLRSIRGATCPYRDEKIIAGISATNQVLAQMWRNGTWTNHVLNPLGNITQSSWSSIDITYEQLSGDALMVWSDSFSLKYSIWTGIAWTYPNAVSTPLAGEAKQVRLASNPGSDEIALIVASTQGDYALIWNGSSWGNAQILNTKSGNPDFTDVAICYEQLTGRALALFSTNDGSNLDFALHYRLWNGHSWSAPAFLQPSIQAGIQDRAKWILTHADPQSNRIAAAILTTASESWAAIWNGTDWSDPEIITTSHSGNHFANLSPGFESQSGDLLLPYGKNGHTSLFYKTWKPGTGWTAEQQGPEIGSVPNTVACFPNRASDLIMVGVQDAQSTIRFVSWNGHTWSSPNTTSTASMETSVQPFTFLWNPLPPVFNTAGYYVMQVDTASLPQRAAFSTDNLESALFLAAGEVSCGNDFGLTRHLPPIARPDSAQVDLGTSYTIPVVANDTEPEGTPLDVHLWNHPSNGTATNNQNGTITYTPDSGFTGRDTFYYSICDQGIPPLCDTTFVSIEVNVFYNDPPVAHSDYDTTLVNRVLVLSVLDNDFDPEFGQLSLQLDTQLRQPLHGTILLFSTEKISYLPDSTFTGRDSFQYVICDDQTPSLCDTGNVFVVVENNPPDARNDAANTTYNTPINIRVLENDSEPDGQGISLVAMGSNGTNGNSIHNGTLVLSNNGTPSNPGDDFISYVPSLGFYGTDGFYYIIRDHGNPTLYDTAYVSIVVTGQIDLELSNTVLIEYVPPGNQTTFKIEVVNKGPTPASNVLVKDKLSSSFTHISHIPPGRYDPVSGIWNINTMGIHDTATLLLTVQVNDDQNLKNTAQVFQAAEKDNDSQFNNDDGDQSEDDEDFAFVFVSEICDNGIDDDSDGLLDCLDPDCASFSITAAAMDATCPQGGLDGSITVNLTGEGPFSFVWSDAEPTARWNFEQNSQDVSGNDHHQNGGAGPVIYVTDRVEGNYALYLGGNTYLRYSADWDFMEVSFSRLSFAAWIKPSDLTGLKTILDEGSNTNGLAVRLNDQVLEAAVKNAGIAFYAGSHLFPNDGQWHHIAVVFDGGKITLYLDGVAGSTTTASFSMVNAHSGNGGLGFSDGGTAFSPGTGDFYKGKMDDVRYYFEKALSADQIADLARNDGNRNPLPIGNYALMVANANQCDTTLSFSIEGETNFTSAGSIQGDESGCAYYDPQEILSSAPPSGGNGGQTEYRWEESMDGGITWYLIQDSTRAVLNPGPITQTTTYRRLARRDVCLDWMPSNGVTKTVINNLETPGGIQGDEIFCGSYDPNLIISSSPGSGGYGGSLIYQWQKSIDGGTSWTDILGAVSETFDPSTITQTTHFRRGARRSHCMDYIYSNEVTKTVVVSFISGGSISGNESGCCTYWPAPIHSSGAPTGGSYGTLEYIWEKSIDNGSSWQVVSGATSATLQPDSIAQTTIFRRGARRSPCNAWAYSNLIIKTHFAPPTAQIIAQPSGQLCENTTYTFESNDAGSGATYSWDMGPYASSSPVSGKGPHMLSFSIPGIQQILQPVTLTVSKNGCQAIDSLELTINAMVEVLSFNINHPSVCSGTDGSIQINANYPSGTSIEVSIDGGNSWGNTNQTLFLGLSAGGYDIYIRYTDGSCENFYGSVNLSDPERPYAIIQETYTEKCTGETFVFQAEQQTGATNYSWNFGSGASPSTAIGRGPHTIYFTTGGLKTVTLVVEKNGCYNSASTEFQVVQNLATGGMIAGDEVVCPGAAPSGIYNSSLPSGGIGGVILYQWERRELVNGSWSNWVEIPGATFGNYTPPPAPVFETAYRRKSRRTPCGNWLYSNEVIKTLGVKPILVNDVFDPVCPGVPYAENVFENDPDAPGSSYSVVLNPSNGSVNIFETGDFIYQPNNAYCGVDSFLYEVCSNGCCDTALVTLDMNDVQDPVLFNIPDDITIFCDERIPLPPFVIALENCLQLTLGLDEISTQGIDNCSLYDYILTRTWSTTDYCGNAASDTQVITIQDHTAPDIFRIYTMPNGKKLVAGVMENVTNRWKIMRLPIDFETKPVILAQVVSAHEQGTVTVRLKNTSDSQFEMRLQEQEAADNIHLSEDVAWIAVEPGFWDGDQKFHISNYFNNDGWKNQSFQAGFTQAPLFFAQMQTFVDEDPAVVRYRNLSTSAVETKLQEEQSFETNTTHPNEVVGFLALKQGKIRNAEGYAFGESGKLSLNHEWQTVPLQLSFHNPVVVAGAISFQDTTSATIRVRNVTASSFDIRLETWDYQDSTHGTEQVAYMVVEGSIPLDTIVNCNQLPTKLQSGEEIIAVDNCDNTVRINFREITHASNCAPGNQLVRIWSANDECGNTVELSQTLFVQDTTPPTFTVPADVTISCQDDLDDLTLTGDVTDESDNCSSHLEAHYVNSYNGAFDCDSVLIVERIWVLTDDCGNATTKTQYIQVENTGITLFAKVFLQGALQNSPDNLMRDDLRKKGLIPLLEPYAQISGFKHLGGGGGESILPTVLQTSGSNAIVDWIFVEMRHPIVEDSVLATHSGLLQRDGDVVDVDGISPIRFPDLKAGSYHVTIRHRNHLGAMTRYTSVFSTVYPTVVDLLHPSSNSFGNFGRRYMPQGYSLWAGDFNADRQSIYQGPNNDIISLFMNVMTDRENQSILPNYIRNKYDQADYDLDGNTIYQGPDNDRAKLLFESVLRTPENILKIPNYILREKVPVKE